jgi:hypothetical protein
MVLDLYVLSLNSMFSHINKEEMEVSIEHDFVTLNAKLELECSMKKEVANDQWGAPRSKLKLSCLYQRWRSLKDQHQKRLKENTQIDLCLLFGILFV